MEYVDNSCIYLKVVQFCSVAVVYIHSFKSLFTTFKYWIQRNLWKLCFFIRINSIFCGLKEQTVQKATLESLVVGSCQHTFCLQKTKDSGKCWWIWQSTWFCMIVIWRFFESTSLGLERLSLTLKSPKLWKCESSSFFLCQDPRTDQWWLFFRRGGPNPWLFHNWLQKKPHPVLLSQRIRGPHGSESQNARWSCTKSKAHLGWCLLPSILGDFKSLLGGTIIWWKAALNF